ncbi:unnamed protein product [Choristocarpus tenellus]
MDEQEGGGIDREVTNAGMMLPPSSLLERISSFLPQMAMANEHMAALSKEGKLELIDSSLGLADQSEDDDSDEESDEEENEDVGEEGGLGVIEEVGEMPSAVKKGSASAADGARIVQLDFALGDFDGTPIAELEAKAEANDKQDNDSSDGDSQNLPGELENVDSTETEEPIRGQGVVEDMLRKGSAARPSKDKPLIEEL